MFLDTVAHSTQIIGVKGVEFEIGFVLLALLDGQFASLAVTISLILKEILPNVRRIEEVGKLQRVFSTNVRGNCPCSAPILTLPSHRIPMKMPSWIAS